MSLGIGGGVRSVRTRHTPDIDDTNPWAKRACRDVDPESFFPFGPGAAADAQYERARTVCNRCPVKARCLAESLERGDLYGMFGGRTPDERRPYIPVKDERKCLTCGAEFEPVRAKQPNCGKCNLAHKYQGVSQAQAFADKFAEQLRQHSGEGMSDKAIAARYGVSYYLIGSVRKLLGIPAQPKWQSRSRSSSDAVPGEL